MSFLIMKHYPFCHKFFILIRGTHAVIIEYAKACKTLTYNSFVFISKTLSFHLSKRGGK